MPSVGRTPCAPCASCRNIPLHGATSTWGPPQHGCRGATRMSARRIAPSLLESRMSDATAPSGVAGDRTPGTPSPLRVLILSAVRLYRDGLASVLPGESSLRIAGTAANDMEALAVIAS